MAGAGMVGMAVGDQRARHRPGRVDMEIARRAIEALRVRVRRSLARTSIMAGGYVGRRARNIARIRMPQLTSGDLLADRRYAYAEACLAEGDAAGAGEMAEQALELAPRFAAAWFLLGRAREALDPRAAATGCLPGGPRLRGALALDPDDTPRRRVRLARLGGGDAAAALSPAYVRALFDGYAPRFERHLVGDLAYTAAPDAAWPRLGERGPGRPGFEVALDLGCGTGLMGAALRGAVSAQLAGVDLSPGMLALGGGAAALWATAWSTTCGLPRRRSRPPQADLVRGGRRLHLRGDFGPASPGSPRVLRPGGLAAFTVQSHDGTGVRPGADGRYAHGDAHMLAAVAGAGLR